MTLLFNFFSGILLNMIGRWQALDQLQRPGSTVIKLAVNIGNAFTHHLGIREALPQDAYFDDDLFFEVIFQDFPPKNLEIIADH